MSSRSATHRSRGFTLLEVMCAFAILAGLTGFLVQVYFKAVKKGSDAWSLRELREAADTLFRRIIYEEHNYHDGDVRTLDKDYAEWAGLRGFARDRWRAYSFILSKKRKTAAGTPDPGQNEEPLFDDGTQDTRGSTAEERAREAAAEEGGAEGQALYALTLSIVETEAQNEEPILVLKTYIQVRDDATTGGGSSGSPASGGGGR